MGNKLVEFVTVNSQRQVDAVFSNTNIYDLDADLDVAPGDAISTCQGDGAGIMIRKDSRIADWWNPAFDQLKMSSEYQRICSEVAEKHGKQIKFKLFDCLDFSFQNGNHGKGTSM